jgi:hypothetical protein
MRRTPERFLNVMLPERRHSDIHSAVRAKGPPMWIVFSPFIKTLQRTQHAKRSKT